MHDRAIIGHLTAAIFDCAPHKWMRNYTDNIFHIQHVEWEATAFCKYHTKGEKDMADCSQPVFGLWWRNMQKCGQRDVCQCQVERRA